MLPHRDEKTGRAILPKTELVDGGYYIGRCRNATVARWSAKHAAFFHWREKFGRIFVERIKHPVDEEYFDVFRVVRVLSEPKFEIPIPDDPESFGDPNAKFEGNVADLGEHGSEMWSRVT